MKRLKVSYQFIVLILCTFLLNACAISDKHQNKWRQQLKGLTNKPLTEQDVAAGLKEALRVGSERVVTRVGKRNGYLMIEPFILHYLLTYKKYTRHLIRLG